MSEGDYGPVRLPHGDAQASVDKTDVKEKELRLIIPHSPPLSRIVVRQPFSFGGVGMFIERFFFYLTVVVEFLTNIDRVLCLATGCMKVLRQYWDKVSAENPE